MWKCLRGVFECEDLSNISMTERELTEKVIGCAIEVHRVLGLGLLESTYQYCLSIIRARNWIVVIVWIW